MKNHNHRSTWITPDDAQAAINRGTGRGIKIAILDSGVELSHPALEHLRLLDDVAFQATGDNLASRAPGWGTDGVGHGTAVARVVTRIAPEAMLGSFRVLDDRNKCPPWMIRHAAMDAIERGYDIINCSFGISARQSTHIDHFKPWIDAAYRRGIHVVSACNNYCFRSPEWPGVFPSVITVNMAETVSEDVYFRWDAKAEVPPGHLVEFAARGMNLELPWKGGQMVQDSGSSFAAPHVAGLLARLLSVYPGLKPPVAKALLQEVALPWEPKLGGG